jgi:hypothetical protein
VRWPDEDLGPDVAGHDWDVEVVFTGLRSGEKLFEELFVEGEEYAPTCHEKIFAAHANGDCAACPVDLDRAVEELIGEARRGDEDRIRAKLREIVPRYTPVQRDGADNPPGRDRDVPRAETQGLATSPAPGHLKVGRRVAKV